METKADRQRLREVFSQINPLSEEEWGQFEPMLETETVRKNDFLIREGQVAKHIYFICEGMVRVYLKGAPKEISLDFAFEHTFVSSYASFLQQIPSAVSIEAFMETRVIRFSRDHLYQRYEASHMAERMGRLIAEFQYLRKNSREIALLKYPATQRYLQLLKQQPRLVQEIPVKYLASYLGVEPESLSRIRKSLGEVIS